jgi:hypothetical protein
MGQGEPARLRTWFQARSLLAIFLVLLSFHFPFVRRPRGLAGATKNPRLTGNRGFWKFVLFLLEIPSHDAKAASGTVPHGRQSIDTLVANANVNYKLHLTGVKEHGFGQLSSASFTAT